jgi:hypothetical protein
MRQIDASAPPDIFRARDCAFIFDEFGCIPVLEAAMRYLFLAVGAVCALTLANAPMARAFDTYSDDSTNADGSPRFADPDEQLDAVADGGGAGGSGYTFRVSDLDVGSGKSHEVESDRTVAWTPDRIRLVFGPYAH